MTRGMQWSYEARDHAIELFKSGQPVATIARTTGVPDSTIRSWVADWGRSPEAAEYIRSEQFATAALGRRVRSHVLLRVAERVTDPNTTTRDLCAVGKLTQQIVGPLERAEQEIASQIEACNKPEIVEIHVPFDVSEVGWLPRKYKDRIAFDGEPWWEVVEEWHRVRETLPPEERTALEATSTQGCCDRCGRGATERSASA